MEGMIGMPEKKTGNRTKKITKEDIDQLLKRLDQELTYFRKLRSDRDQ